MKLPAGALICLLFLTGLLGTAPSSRADEIRLKDGSKIIGTIVGYENDSFKVQTSYGFALVRKDRIAAIVPTEAKDEPAAKAKKPVEPPATAKVAPAAVAKAEPPANPPSASSDSPSKVAPGPPGPPPPAAPDKNVASAKPAPAAAPAPVDEPPVIHDEVSGNLYINHTYGFQMYKPPGWEVIEGAQKALPEAVVAMGTSDETTLLIVGRTRLKDTLEAHAAAAERELREIYDNYRELSTKRTQLAGLPAIEWHFRGTADEHDWSVRALTLARGNDVFTILGMTYADSDLIQIQENVIARTITSLQFTSR